MAKKNFKTGIDGLLQPSLVNEKLNKDKGQADSKSVKATYYLDSSTLEQIKAIAFYDRKPIGHIIDEALRSYVSSYADIKKAMNLFKSE